MVTEVLTALFYNICLFSVQNNWINIIQGMFIEYTILINLELFYIFIISVNLIQDF